MVGPTAILLVCCPDQRGLVAKIAHFIYSHNGNIIHADHHTDGVADLFLTRIEWEVAGFALGRSHIAEAFETYAQEQGLFPRPEEVRWHLDFSDRVSRLAIWVSRQDHCLLDLIWRQRASYNFV